MNVSQVRKLSVSLADGLLQILYLLVQALDLLDEGCFLFDVVPLPLLVVQLVSLLYRLHLL